ncbi:MAG: methyltransferase domain-containing protein [Planctomycetaceae bacterium]
MTASLTSLNRPAGQPAEASVHERYAAAAEALQPSLCCPIEYSPDLLSVIPQEIIERDYGCGDPTPYVRRGDTVVDLGSGGGKLCFIAAQLVGPDGRVIGVDCNQPMLALARKHVPTVAERLGYQNVEFRYGLIQDLALDLDLLGDKLAEHPVADPSSYLALRNVEEQLRSDFPLVPDGSVDCVLSNCVLNLVRQRDRSQLFSEIQRVLKPGGRAAISDIVSDEPVPAAWQEDPELWSGCLSGAYTEDGFIRAFEEAGFHGIQIVKRQQQPWRIIGGIEFRSVTVVAYKDVEQRALDRNQAVIYRGPFKKVEDDHGCGYVRGARMAVSDATFERLRLEPYQQLFDLIEPHRPTALEDAQPFRATAYAHREPGESKKGASPPMVQTIGSCCGNGGQGCE